jgi:hypothetical protein
MSRSGVPIVVPSLAPRWLLTAAWAMGLLPLDFVRHRLPVSRGIHRKLEAIAVVCWLTTTNFILALSKPVHMAWPESCKQTQNDHNGWSVR